MKVLVTVKRVVDPNVRPRLRADGLDVDLAAVKMAVNPFDEIAIEEAMRLKERGVARETVAVSLGPPGSQEGLRHALAMGMDRAIWVEVTQRLEPLTVAKLLKEVVAREQPDLAILGKQAIDDDAGQTGQMLAALWGVGQGTFASRLQIQGEEVEVVREVEGGTETVRLKLPAVVTADLRLNEPRFVKLPNLMMAKKKPIEILSVADWNVDLKPALRSLRFSDPPVRQSGTKVVSAAELFEKLQALGVIGS